MRKLLLISSLLLTSMVAPTVADEPSLSPTTLARLDDRLRAAGSDWRTLFDTLHPAQQEAMLRLNSVVRVVSMTSIDATVAEVARPRACEWLGCDEAVANPPPQAQRPIEQDVLIQAPPPYECNSGQGEVYGYNLFGKVLTHALDWIAYCIDGHGKFVSYDHGHEANTYGWGWQVGGCICTENGAPPVPGDERVHTFRSIQSYHRQFGIGEFGFTDTSISTIEGYAKANGPYDGNHYIFGW